MSKKIDVMTFHHQWAYVELAKSIRDALREYGFESNYYDNVDNQEDFNIVISGQPYPIKNENAINIQFETDHIELTKTPPNYYLKFTRSLHWSDYKKDLRDKNIYYCPIGYSKHFDTNMSRNIIRDTFHMGRTSVDGGDSVRHYFRQKHNLFTINYAGTEPIIGDERDLYITSSKVNINSRLYENYWFTPMHAALIIHKGKLLLQDDCGKDDYNWYKDYIVLFTEEDFNDKIKYWINNNKERNEFEEFIYKEVKEKHSFEKYFYGAMSDLLETYI